jgi:pilus assembly protein CpaB
MSRRITAVIAALIIAVVGSVAVVTYARAADQRALAGQEAVRAYVAAKQVPAGTTAAQALQDGLIVQELIARKGVPDDALTSVQGEYAQLVATSAIQPGEIVLGSRFAARGAAQGALPVPAGLLAVSVSLDDPSHVGAFVTVGSKVAVFDTFNVQEADKSSLTPAGDHLQDNHAYTRATRLLLPSVEVLAVDDSTTVTQPSESKDKPAGLGTAALQPTTTLLTLAVTQDQAQKLVHGSRTGTLTFALLGPDAKATPVAGVNDRTLFGGAR